MRIALYIRHIEDTAQPYLEQLVGILHKHHVETIEIDQLSTLNSQLKPDFLFSIGGDGTLLSSVHLIGNSGVPVVGINFGHLGFLTTVGKDRLEDFVCHLIEGRYTVEERSLLQCAQYGYALNEVYLHRSVTHSLLYTDLFVNGEFVSTYAGDGLIIATPTGSTAYSLSCGGPILTPDCGCLVVTPIGAHTLTLRPIVIADTAEIRLVTDPNHADMTLGLDSNALPLNAGSEVLLHKADFTIRLVRMNGQNFFSAIQEKLSWGVGRNR